jgi:hypothetical protein
MPNYLVLYHAPVSASQQMAAASPEQAKAGMDAWMQWAKKAGPAIIDLGKPLGNGAKISGTSVDASSATIVGYSILHGHSKQAVTRLMQDHPHLRMPGFSIEVFEALSMPGM